MRVACSLLLAGCGRLAFEHQADASPVVPLDAAADAAPPPCTSPFSMMSTGCYAYFSTPLGWSAAQAQCVGLSSTLVVIADQVENDLVETFLPATQRMWIGLTDSAMEQTFVWLDGVTATYTFWGTGEPNSDINDCVEMTDSGRWNEEACPMARNFTCER